MISSDSESDISTYSETRSNRRNFSAVSPNYDTESDSEEEDRASLYFSTDSSLSNNISEGFETSASEVDSNMSRRSGRLNERSSGNSSSSSNSAGPSHRTFTPELNDSNDTVDYDFDNMSEDEIVINDTQHITSPQGARATSEDDDDVILIPQHIETIDLCTQMLPSPRRFRHPVAPNEVIEIQDSPLTQQRIAMPLHSRLESSRNIRTRNNLRSDAVPYRFQNASAQPTRLSLNDSQNDSQNGNHMAIKINCPVCMDSVLDKQPVSTACGHIFCKQCITVVTMKKAAKCPMCNRTMKKGSVHDIFLES